MSMLLENARLCLDCDTIFDEPRCPKCSGESFFPLSRWVRPHLPELAAADAPVATAPVNPAPVPAVPPPAASATKKARNTSLVLFGSGMAYAVWRLLKTSDHNDNAEKKDSAAPKNNQPAK